MNIYRLSGLVIACIGTSAGAQEPASSTIVSDLAACRAITDPTERLTCFDGAAARLVDATTRKDVVILDRTDVRKTKRSLFGFSLPKLPFFGNEDERAEEDEIKTIESTVAAVQSLGGGKWSIKLVEGAVWRTTEAMTIEPFADDPVKITKGAIGNHFLTVRGARGVRAIRTN